MRLRNSLAGFLIAAALAGCSFTPRQKEADFLRKGREFLEKKDYARAILQFQNAAKSVPNDAEPYYQLGRAGVASGNAVGAYAALKKAVELNPNHAGAQCN